MPRRAVGKFENHRNGSLETQMAKYRNTKSEPGFRRIIGLRSHCVRLMNSLKPDCQWPFREKGHKACPAGKVGHFLQSGLILKYAKLRQFSRLPGVYRGFSLQSRLRGGEGGIRTRLTTSIEGLSRARTAILVHIGL
jgi:hypothetical protein